MILLDAGIMIAQANKEDSYHERAMELLALLNENHESLMITEAVLSEVVTYIARKRGPEEAAKFARAIIASVEIEILISSKEDASMALDLLQKYELNSYSDSLSMAIMESRNIKKIASFDSDFDRNPNIKRIK